MLCKSFRVILIGGNGTGKTAILDAFVTKSSQNQEGDIIFGIHQVDNPSARPLLQLNLEVKYEKLKINNVSVKTFVKLESLKECFQNSAQNTPICLDEVYMQDIEPEELLKIKAKQLWIVVRDIPGIKDIEKYLRKKFPSKWVIVNLSYPLRTSKTISEWVKRSGKVNDLAHSNNCNEFLQIPANMPLGPKPLILQRSNER